MSEQPAWPSPPPMAVDDLSRRVNELVEGIADAVDVLSTVILYGEQKPPVTGQNER